ncbi:pre-rRNA-processing protein TSR2 homolog [Cimex lectularius]|uniref:Pre-rRNA-processing protein TSR2 homolog n=1 Tax=Cimex lectularius TaxID=79782 RepID=A0A8I6RGU0_CIMLE|nr:pre-rRNA-processing protein TSR2 homolog [Cimex lectularius]
MEVDGMEQLSHYVGIIMNNWYAFTLAIDHNFAGCTPRETEKKVIDFVDFISQKLAAGTDPSDFIVDLEDVMDAEFHTLLEDDSAPAVVEALIEMHQIYQTGDLLQMEAFIRRQGKSTPIQQVFTVPEVHHRTASESVPQLHHDNVDSEGWTQVTHRRR